MKVSLVFVRDRRFFFRPSSKFLKRRRSDPFPQGKTHYVFGEPPLGIMYLSSVLKEAGHEVALADQAHPEYTDERFVEGLTRERPDLVGLSFLSNQCYPAARALSRKIKTSLPSARIVLGGVFPTINARKIVESEGSVDIVARGEGEGIIRELTTSPGRVGDIPGLTFRSSRGEVIETPDREPIADLDSIPFPDRETLDIHYVASLPLDVPAVIWDRPYTTIVSSRGCSFACTYCNCPTFGRRRWRARSAENVFRELEQIAAQGYTSFCFLDDNFLLNPSRVASICDGIVKQGCLFRWACEGRADPRTDGIFEKLASAGCDVVMFGIESGSQRVLNSMNKGTKIEHIERAVESASKAGIDMIHGFFIVGSPGETPDEVRQTFEFAERIPLTSFAFNSLTAFRGTALWNDAVARGLIDEEKDWDKVFALHAIHPDAIDSKSLFRLRSDLVRRLIRRKFLRHPLVASRVLRRFLSGMSALDLYRLLTSSRQAPASA